MLKCHVLVKTRAGHYAERGFAASNMVEATQKLSRKVFDELPDTIEGESLMDWTEIVLTVKR